MSWKLPRQRDPGARPGRELEAEPRGAGVDLVAVGDLVGADQRHAPVQREARGEAVAGGEIDAVAMAADRQLGLRVELEPVVEQALGRAQLQDLRAGAAAVGEAVVGDGEAGARRKVAAAIFDEGAPGDPLRFAAEIILVPGAAGQRQRFAEAGAGVDADLPGAVLRRVELADAEAALALARISEDVEAAVVMLGLDLPGQRRAALRPEPRPPPAEPLSLTAISARISVEALGR